MKRIFIQCLAFKPPFIDSTYRCSQYLEFVLSSTSSKMLRFSFRNLSPTWGSTVGIKTEPVTTATPQITGPKKPVNIKKSKTSLTGGVGANIDDFTLGSVDLVLIRG